MKLTDKSIALLTCEPGKKDRLVFDDAVPGLGLRISVKGAKAFVAQYTVAGAKRRLPIGRWGAISLDQARVAARVIFGDVAKGLDPARIRADASEAAKASSKADKLTLDALLVEWETLALAPRRESYRREALRAMRVAYKRQLSQAAGSLTRATALAVLDGIVKGGRTAIAGRTLAYGRACYGWAKRRGVVAVNPFEGLPISAGTVSRDRVLSAGELAAVWRHLPGLGWPFAPLLQLLVLTAQRRDEVGSMRWSELSEDGTIWTIPKERAKNGRAHVVHLAPAARNILAQLPRVDGSDLVFTTTGRTPASGFTRPKNRLDEAIAAELGQPLPPWRLHDLRRTAVTWMADNGIAPHVADRLLNHVQGTISGVAAVYQRGEFLAERKVALEAWARQVAGTYASVSWIS